MSDPKNPASRSELRASDASPGTAPHPTPLETPPEGDVLEQNISQLLTQAHDPPRMSDAARGRILAALKRRTARSDERSGPLAWATPGRLGLAAAAACALVIAGLSWVYWPHPAAPSPWQTLHNPGPGPQRHALADGSFLVLRSGATVRVSPSRQARVVSGDALFDVARQKQPFVVETPHGRVVVLGTRFLVSAAGPETLTAVVRGKVRVESDQGQATLGAGDEAVLAPSRKPERRRAPRLSHLVGWATAEGGATRVSDAPVRRGTLYARHNLRQQEEFPLPLRRLAVDVHVENQVARVAMDQTFFNPEAQQLEGVYSFPLPPEAAVSRLSMYVEGQLQEGAIVEREQGRRIYEDIVYTNRDPALLEWMAGNLFRVRIFPLPARSEKRVVLSYTQTLRRLYRDVRLAVPIPQVDHPVQEVDFRVLLKDCPGCQVLSTSHAVTVTPQGRDVRVTFTARKHRIGASLLLTVRHPDDRPRVAWQSGTDLRFLGVGVKPTLPDGARAAGTGPRRWVVLYDTSASRTALVQQAQAFFVRRLLGELDPEDELAVVAFDTTTRPLARSFQKVREVQAWALQAFLARESGDGVGATDLEGALRAASDLLQTASKEATEKPHVLLVSDGLATTGERRPAELARQLGGRATVVAVAVGDPVDGHLLRSLTSATGGYLMTLSPGDDLAWQAFDLVAALHTPRVTDLEARLLGGDGQAVAARIYLGSTQVAEGEEVSLLARMDVKAGTPTAIVLSGRIGSERFRQTVDLAPAQATQDATYLSRLWAQAHVDALVSDRAEANRPEITRLGLEEFLVTPYTSLLVLENEKMYAQYKLGRRGGATWAAYALPPRIPVVTEPGPTQAVGVGPQEVLWRQPVELLTAHGGQGRWRSHEAFGARVRVVGMSGSDRLGEDVVGAAIDLASESNRRGDYSWTVPGRDEAERGELAYKYTADAEDTIRRPSSSWGDGKNTLARRLDAPGLPWPEGSSGERRTGGFIDPSIRLVGLVQGWEKGEDFRGFSGSQLFSGQLGYAGSIHLDDLTELVPGLFATDHDVPGPAPTAARGSVSPEASRALAAARRALAGRRYALPGGVSLTVEPAGRFRRERRTSFGLREQVVYDGVHLLHVYPELGLVTRRDVARVRGSWISALWLPADADLALGHEVTLGAAGSLELKAVPGGDVLRIGLDPEHRITALVRLRQGRVLDQVKLSHGSGTLVMEQGAERTTIEVGASNERLDAVAAELTRVDLPLRRSAHWIALLGPTPAATAENRDRARQLVASLVAERQWNQLWPVLARLKQAVGTLTRGELALASLGARFAPSDAELARVAEGALPSDAVPRYLLACRRFALTQQPESFAALAQGPADSLITTLAAYRQVLAVIDRDRQAEAERLTAAFVRRNVSEALRYVVVSRYADRHGWSKPAGAILLLDQVATEGPLWAVAQGRAARLLYQAQRHDEAASRYEQLYTRTLAAGQVPPVEHLATVAYERAGRGESGWRLFWSGLATRALRSGSERHLVAFASVSAQHGHVDDLLRATARFEALKDRSLAGALELSDLLLRSGQIAQAEQLLAPLLAGSRPASASGPAPAPEALRPQLLEQAARVAERMGKAARAAELMDRALTEIPRLRLSEARPRVAWILARYTRAALVAPGPEREAAVSAALKVLSRWRRIDPAHPDLARQAARLLYAAGRPVEAWRHLSTILERSPGDGPAHAEVAEVLEAEGRLDDAMRLWRQAAALEPTNPTWTLRQAQLHTAQGRSADTCPLLDGILEATWHSRFLAVTQQARQLRVQARCTPIGR